MRRFSQISHRKPIERTPILHHITIITGYGVRFIDDPPHYGGCAKNADFVYGGDTRCGLMRKSLKLIEIYAKNVRIVRTLNGRGN